MGKKSPGHIEYANKVVSEIEANPNMEWIEQIPNEDIYKLCRECRVSVLPSWFETPGLVSLEAAAMGAISWYLPKERREIISVTARFIGCQQPFLHQGCAG